MKKYHFLFHVGNRHLSDIAVEYKAEIYIDVRYEAGGDYSLGTGFCIVYHIGSTGIGHKHIKWSDELYIEIDHAARSNWESQYQSKKEFA